jgi:hypothetical protein
LYQDPVQPDPRHCQMERRRLQHVLAGLGEILHNPARRERLQRLIAWRQAT